MGLSTLACICMGVSNLTRSGYLTVSNYQGKLFTPAGQQSYASTFSSGTIVGVAVDLDNWTINFSVNGLFKGVLDLSSIGKLTKGEMIFPYVWESTGSDYNVKGTAAFKKEDLTYAIPDGYKAFEEEPDKSLILHNDEYKKFIPTQEAIPGNNLIPVMTGETTPAPYAISSSTAYGGYVARYAVDRIFNGSSRWIASGVAPQWLKIDLGSPQVAFTYQLASGHMEQRVVSWILRGNNNNVDWVDLHAVNDYLTNIDAYSNFTIPTPGSYRYYMVYMTKALVNGADGGLPSLSGFTLLTEHTDKIPGQWKVISSHPTTQQFIEQGMDNAMTVFDRKLTTFDPIAMIENNEVLEAGQEGKVFSQTINLKRLMDIRSIKMEVK